LAGKKKGVCPFDETGPFVRQSRGEEKVPSLVNNNCLRIEKPTNSDDSCERQRSVGNHGERVPLLHCDKTAVQRKGGKKANSRNHGGVHFFSTFETIFRSPQGKAQQNASDTKGACRFLSWGHSKAASSTGEGQSFRPLLKKRHLNARPIGRGV